MRKLFLFLGVGSLSLLTQISYGQSFLDGKVWERSEAGDTLPVIGANVFWLSGEVGTVTGPDGRFSLEIPENARSFVVSYVGYPSDTLIWDGDNNLDILLSPGLMLDAVEVKHRQKSTSISMLEVNKVETMGEKELLKAACCNLSESFETNPSIDVSYTDAVTGTRQIQLLGLAGPYTQITRESVPDIRGFAAIHGLGFIPGAWIESIQLSKGMGSVANGFESMAGQINVELQKPDAGEKWFFNAYVNEMTRAEGNIHWRSSLNDRWSTAVLLHGKFQYARHDRNQDGFLDVPRGYTATALNRWKYQDENGLQAQFGFKGSWTDKIAGQTDFRLDKHRGDDQVWGMQDRIQRLEGWGKIGKVFYEQPGTSLGLQFKGATQRQDAFFGLRNYDADQHSAYVNFLFESIIGNTNHQYRLGTSLQYDDYREQLDDTPFDRIEWVPGIWGEYTYKYLDKVTLVAGIRADRHNIFGWFYTPRLHFRYAPFERTAFRLSAGRGQRTANIISENLGLLATSRQLVILGNDPEKPYGLDQEIAWNFGFNFTQEFRLDYRDGVFTVDLYRTQFENQIVIDLDQSPQQALFFNLEGQSYANSVQVQLDYELIQRLDIRLAYRWYDLKTTFASGDLRQKPLVARHRAFVNLEYNTRNHWSFDMTANWQGSKRIPDTDQNPVPYRLEGASPAFVTVNAQVRKTWQERIDVYLGVENLFNFRQANPILGANDPFGPYFDSSLVWGPIFGRNVYAGFRLKIR